MKKLESSLLNMVAVLTVVSLCAAGLLAWVHSATAEPIKEQSAKIIADGIKSVMGSDKVQVASTDTVRVAFDDGECVFVVHAIVGADGKSAGSAVESSVMGFGGELRVLSGFSVDGHILGYKVLQSSETPGLGQKADRWFQKDGKGNIINRRLSVENPLAVTKDNGDVDAITSSTITSRAFLKAVNRAFAAYRQMQKDDKTEENTSASEADEAHRVVGSTDGKPSPAVKDTGSSEKSRVQSRRKATARVEGASNAEKKDVTNGEHATSEPDVNSGASKLRNLTVNY